MNAGRGGERQCCQMAYFVHIVVWLHLGLGVYFSFKSGNSEGKALSDSPPFCDLCRKRMLGKRKISREFVLLGDQEGRGGFNQTNKSKKEKKIDLFRERTRACKSYIVCILRPRINTEHKLGENKMGPLLSS